MEHVGNLLRLSRLVDHFQGRIETARHDGSSRHAPPVTVGYELYIEILGTVHRSNIEAVVGGSEGDLLEDLEERALLVREQIPRVIPANTGHRDARGGVSTMCMRKNYSTERGGWESRVCWGTDTAGIDGPAIFGPEEAIFGP